MDEKQETTQKIAVLEAANKRLLHELAEKETLLKKTQINAAQLQFNQHFLFNTLNLISVLSYDHFKGKNPISKAITLLSGMLRISLDTTQYTTTVAGEILYAKKYIEIEQLKYENSYTVSWDIDPEIEQCKIIKLVFQPIIENAFLYGLQPLPGETEKKLIISGKLQDDTIVFHFIDNGMGFKPEMLEALKLKFAKNEILHTEHIGLANINSRIRLVFGEPYGITITSSENGSDVQLVIPMIKGADDQVMM